MVAILSGSERQFLARARGNHRGWSRWRRLRRDGDRGRNTRRVGGRAAVRSRQPVALVPSRSTISQPIVTGPTRDGRYFDPVALSSTITTFLS